MSLDVSQVKVSALFSLILRATKKLSGKTKLQKIAYIIDKTGWNILKDYRYHYYGPYSDQITVEIQNLRSRGWLEEKFSAGGGITLYSYNLTKAGERIADYLATRVGNPKLVQRSIGIARDLAKFSTRELELMATLVFLHDNYSLKDEQLVTTIKELKPYFNDDEINDGVRIFKMLASWRLKD